MTLEPDEPLSLVDICEQIFGGSISPATLKAEHRRGNLELFKIGRKYFTTRRHVEAMIEKCRLQVQASQSKPDHQTEKARAVAALAALKLTVEKLKAAGRKKRSS